MAVSQPFPSTAFELLNYYYAQYDADIASGKYEPIVLPWCSAGATVAFAYLLLPYQNSTFLRKARYLVFASLLSCTMYQIVYCRTRNMAACYGNGVIGAWLVIMCAANNLFNDAQADFQRITYMDHVSQTVTAQNGHFNEGSIEQNKESTEHPKKPCSDECRKGYTWQPYPQESSFKDRLGWVLDLNGSTRGMNWNWRTRTIPPPPKNVRAQLRANPEPEPRMERPQIGVIQTDPTRGDLLRANFKVFIISYLCLDLAKGIMARDPYFWGIFDRPPPAYLPTFISNSTVLLRAYRLYVTLFGIRYALEIIFTLGPLFFVGIASPLFGIWAEPWMYPRTFGSPMLVVKRGLAGTWADWWHQTFRFGLEAPSKRFISATGMNPRSVPAKLIQALTAFALSGFMHACGSATQAGPTNPIRGPFMFFVTQALGCVVEDVLTKLIRRTGLHAYVPKYIRWGFTVVYLHVWGYYTGPLMADDMAKGGIWLTDPVPFSPLRALGVGPPGDDRWLAWGGWPWEGQWAYFHRGSTWWKSGLAL